MSNFREVFRNSKNRTKLKKHFHALFLQNCWDTRYFNTNEYIIISIDFRCANLRFVWYQPQPRLSRQKKSKVKAARKTQYFDAITRSNIFNSNRHWEHGCQLRYADLRLVLK